MKKINSSLIKNVVLSLMAYVGIILYYGISNNFTYSLFFILAYIPILLLFLKKSDFSKDEKRVSLILSIFITLILVIGKMVNNSINEIKIIFDLKHIFLSLVEVICLIPLFYKLLNYFYHYLRNIDIYKDEKVNKRNSKKFFFIAIAIIFVSYLFYLWRYFPGKLSYDSHVQLNNIKNGILSDWHPFLHTRLVGIFYTIGLNIFHNENMAIAFYIVFQMLVMAVLFAYVCKYLYEKKVDIRICIIVLLCYTLLPQYTHYSVTLWKDVLFGGSFILILISLLEFSFKNFSIRQFVLFTIGMLMLMFFRNNGIYIALFITPFILFIYKNKRKTFAILLGLLFVIYFVVKGPVYDYLGVKKTANVESLSIPLQQIARVVALDKNIDAKSYDYLNTIIDTDKIKDNYLPYISDPIKNMINKDKLEETKIDFFKVWLTLLIKNPNIYFEAYFSQTLGYWYPDVNYWATVDGRNIPTTMPTPIAQLINSTANKKIPFSYLCWSIGFSFLTLLLSYSLSLLKKKKYLVAYTPFLGLWITMMIATPVYAEFRYIYGLICVIPLIILLPFLKEKLN